MHASYVKFKGCVDRSTRITFHHNTSVVIAILVTAATESPVIGPRTGRPRAINAKHDRHIHRICLRHIKRSNSAPPTSRQKLLKSKPQTNHTGPCISALREIFYCYSRYSPPRDFLLLRTVQPAERFSIATHGTTLREIFYCYARYSPPRDFLLLRTVQPSARFSIATRGTALREIFYCYARYSLPRDFPLLRAVQPSARFSIATHGTAFREIFYCFARYSLPRDFLLLRTVQPGLFGACFFCFYQVPCLIA